MDTVPSAFVFSLVETLLTSNNFWRLEHMEELGCGYGSIVREVYKVATTCSITTPGVFFKTPFNEDRLFVKAPIFSGAFLAGKWKPPLLKNLLKLNVRSRSLFFEEDDALLEGTSIREIRRLMEQFRHVRVRELAIERFPSATVPRTSIALVPDLVTFFNRVSLRYDNTDSCREFLLALVEEKKLQRLELNHSLVDRSPNTTPPHWLQDTIWNTFFQPQLQQLEVNSHPSWASRFLLHFLLQKWLSEPETFLETTRSLEFDGAPPIDFLRIYGFGSTGETLSHEDYHVRPFLLPHPRSRERIVEIEVCNGSFYENDDEIDVEAVSDDEFFNEGFLSRVHFRFNRGDNAK
uniref:F-box domain-containing protein n=1 Tax=Steinernema glaseri TaxID=37863 RepID=A0A1I7Z0V3_9BILA